MSRVGELPIKIPDGIEVKQEDDFCIVKSDKGILKERINPNISIEIKDNILKLKRINDDKFQKSLHGLYRSLINNMILGLKDGFEKRLEIHGVGYKVEVNGKAIIFSLGYSHPIYFIPPEDITIDVPAQNNLFVKGFDKQLVGEVAAKIRSFRPPEPYKGKGIRYVGEYVRRKAGKTAV